MASQDDTPTKKLHELWKRLGLEPEATEAQHQIAAAEALGSWVGDKARPHLDLLKLCQALLADPDVPGAAQRPAVQTLIDNVRGAWITAGYKDKLVALQAVAVAAWARGIVRPFVRSLAMNSVLLPPIRQQRAWVNEWAGEVLEPWSTDPQISAATPRIKARPTLGLQAPDPSFTTELNNLITGSKALQNFPPTVLGNGVMAVVKSIPLLEQRVDELSASVSALEKAVPTESRADAEVHLLWWGQARYSSRRRTPFRRMEHDEALVPLVAEMAVLVRPPMSVEAASAYLVEVMHALGHDTREVRTLDAWIRATQSSFRQGDIQLSDSLSKWLAQDATGLPVLWSFLGEDTARAAERTGLTLSATLDRGTWAGWMLREVILARKIE